MRGSRIKIEYKLAAVFFLLFLIVFVSAFLFLYRDLKALAFDRLETRLVRETDLAAWSLRGKEIKGSPSFVPDSYADKTGELMGLRVTLIGSNGSVLGDSRIERDELSSLENHLYRPEVQLAIEQGTGTSQRYSTTVQKDMLYVASRIPREGPLKGVIRYAMPLSRVRDILGEPRYLLAGTAFASVLFIFFAIYIVSFLVSKPLKELAGAAANIASGDKRERFLYRHNDEIGDLARSLNEMREQISKRLAEVLSGRSRLEAVLLSMFDGVMVLDKKGKIVLVNRALKNIFRIEKDLAGKSAIEALRNVEVQEITEDVLSGGRQSLAREIEVLVPDEKILVVHAAQIRRSEQVEGAVLVFHDISGIRKLENIRKDFVANVSHELRTPVSNIKGYTETLLEGAISDEKNAGQFLKIINEDSERLETLISDLLDLARLESGKLALDIGECDTRAFVENCIKEMTSKAETKNVQISPAIEKDIKHMKADPMRLAQCMRNLIDNAVKYTHRGDTIKVSAENDDGFIRISVRDNGPGIGEEHLPRIFERFYRVDKARSRELGGTGLGLSIVKHIVTEHGGTVTVRSVPGNGSEFSFTIPRA